MTEDLKQALTAAFDDPVDAADAAAAHARHHALLEAAEREGLVDVAYRHLDSPLGTLLLAATAEGLVRVAFATEDQEAVLSGLADAISPRVLRSPTRLDPTARQLEEYFAGTRHTFDLPLDWRLSRGFRSVVLHALPSVGYGETTTYAALAREVGNPKAVRAVGSACATNPLPLVVPCHRVLPSNGGLGGYRGGAAAKELLLALERGAA